MADSNFQDVVVLDQDTLYNLGAQFNIGTTSASTVAVVFSNSNAALALAAVPTVNTTVWLPAGGGSLLSNINISAGTTSQNLSAVTLANANGISFGLDPVASVITASISPLASVNFSAGTTSLNLESVTFADSNGISFGLSGNSVITASANSLAAAAGTQTATSGTVVFSNSNNVSFGMSNSSVITASAQVNLSAGTTSNNLSAAVFSNLNNVSFGLNGSTITASATVASTQASINLSAGTTSNLASAFTFSNSNNVSFGLNASTITASANSLAVAAGTQTATSGTAVFSNSNGFTFGMSNSSVITASFGQSVTAFSQDTDFVTNFSISQATMSMQKVSFPMNLSATQLAFLAIFSGATNSSGAVTVSHAVYTFNGSTASLASSGSRQFSWTSGSATSASSQYGGASGTRYRTIPITYNMTPGDYLFAWWAQTTNAVTVRMYGRQAANIVGMYDGVETSFFLNGTSVSSFNTAFPSSIAATNTNYARTGVGALRQPGAILIGSGL